MLVRFGIDLNIFDQKNAMANIYAALNEAMSNLRGEVKAVKECLDDPLDSVRKLQLNLEAANTDNEELRQNFRDLEAQYTELESCLYSRGGLEGQIKVLESSVKEKDKEIAQISQQNNELRNLRSPQKITDFDSADDLTISQESNIIGKLEKEKRDLLEQLQLVTRERDGARKHKELMQGVYKSKEDSRKKLQEENNTLCKQVASLKAQRQLASPASLSARSAGRSTSVGSLQLSGSSMTQVAGLEAQRLSTSGYTHIASRSPSVGSLQSSTPSTTQVPREQAATNFYAGSNAPRTPVRQTSGSFGNLNFSPISPARNHNRQISSASPLSRTRPILTRTQERVMAAVQHLPDDHLEALESGGAFKSVEKGYHWVKAVSFSLDFLSSS